MEINRLSLASRITIECNFGKPVTLINPFTEYNIMDAARLRYLNYLCYSIKDRIRLISGCRLFFPLGFKVTEVEETVWRGLTNSNIENYCDTSILSHGNQILLKKGEWCLKDLVHQILLILSPLSRFSQLNSIFHSFIEGLAELFTGYFLMRYEKECYESWRFNRNCKIENCEDVKLSYFLTLKIGLREVFDVFFRTEARSVEQLIEILNTHFQKFLVKKLTLKEPILLQLNEKLTPKVRGEFMEWLTTQTPILDLKQIKNILY